MRQGSRRFVQRRCKLRVQCVCQIQSAGIVASFAGAVNVWAPPPNNSVKRTAFRGRLLRALGGRCKHFHFSWGRRNVQGVARISFTATVGGAGAFGFMRPPSRRVALGFARRLRRRRSHKSVASLSFAASIRRIAFATFTAWAASLRSPARLSWWHRRLTTRSSGRRSIAFVLPNVAAGAAYLKR